MKRFIYIILLASAVSWSQSTPGKLFIGTASQQTSSPQITGQTVDNITTSSFRVSWSVSPNATGQVEFYKTDTPGTLYYTTLQPTYDQNHIQSPGQIINGSPNGTALAPNTSYTFRVIGDSEFDGGYAGSWTAVTTLADVPNATISVTDAICLEEGLDPGEWTVSLDASSVITTTVNYLVSGSATSGADFSPLSGSVDILDGQSSATIALTPLQDLLVEGNENVILTLTTGNGYNVGTPSSGAITITDNDASGDPVATIVANDATATENGQTTGQWTVSLDAPSVGVKTVTYIVGGTASASDYSPLSGTVDIPDGFSSATITLTPQDDFLVEPNETVTLTLDTGIGYTIGTPNNATVTIISDDGSGSLLATVTSNDKLATEEGLTTGQFTFSLSEVNSTGSGIPINYHMEGNATEGVDYGSTTGIATIADGQQSVTLDISPLQDTDIEFKEDVEVVIDAGAGYTTKGFDRAVLEIVDNDNVSGSYPTTSGTSTIANATDFQNPANAGTRATVTGSFSVTGLTPANGMVLVPGGGILSGTLDISSIGIENADSQLFSSSIVFSSRYDKSRLSIEMFGAGSGDVTDDHLAIQTAINQCVHVTARSNGSYVKNDNSTFGGGGYLDFDLNGSTISTTSAANFNTSSYSIDEVFRFDGRDPHVYNGTFDLTDTYGRLFRVLNYTGFSFKDLIVQNFYNPTPIRSYAIRGGAATNLTYGSFMRNTFRNITAAGDGTANNSDGISKGIWMECGTISNADFEIVHYGNTYHNITGDDAEAIYYTASGDRLHNGHTLIDNDTFYEIGRRAIKMTKGQFTVQNCDFTELSLAQFSSVQLTASMIDVFSTTTVDLQNFYIVNNSIKSYPNQYLKRWLLSITDSQNGYIYGNTFDVWNARGYSDAKTPTGNGLGVIRIGSNTSTYDGAIRNLYIENNLFINGSIETMQYYNGSTSEPTYVDNNHWRYTNVTGVAQAPLDYYTSGSDLKGFIRYTNNVVDFEVAPGSMDGIISSDASGISITDVLISNNQVNFLAGSATYEVGNIAGALTNSTVTTNTWTNPNGNADLNIVGSQTGTTASGNTPTVIIN